MLQTRNDLIIHVCLIHSDPPLSSWSLLKIYFLWNIVDAGNEARHFTLKDKTTANENAAVAPPTVPPTYTTINGHAFVGRYNALVLFDIFFCFFWHNQYQVLLVHVQCIYSYSLKANCCQQGKYMYLVFQKFEFYCIQLLGSKIKFLP